MENHKSVPPLKKIKKHECIDKLRIDYKCPENKNDYSLQINMIKDYSKNLFIPNIAKTILSIVNNKDTEKQPIYNTDCSRYNYVIKITSNNWDEDKSGIKFTDYVIRPLLKYIRDLNEEYIENILEKVDMYRQNYYENEKLVYIKNDAYEFDLELTIILKGGFTEDLIPLAASRFLTTDSILKSINNARTDGYMSSSGAARSSDHIRIHTENTCILPNPPDS